MSNSHQRLSSEALIREVRRILFEDEHAGINSRKVYLVYLPVNR
jgi:hypothetical protein